MNEPADKNRFITNMLAGRELANIGNCNSSQQFEGDCAMNQGGRCQL